MDQDETTSQTVEEPTATETAAEEAEGKRGPILQTLAARITIRYPFERTEADEELAKTIDLTNAAIAGALTNAIEDHLTLTSYEVEAAGFTVNVTAEKV